MPHPFEKLTVAENLLVAACFGQNKREAEIVDQVGEVLEQTGLAAKANPIGVDFGSDALRMVQVQAVGGEHKVIAAASADVPPHVRHDPAGRLQFFVEAARDLLAQGRFRGRQAVLALPAASMFIQHLRIAKMDDESLKKALPWEARGKLPIDPSHALLRHIVAGDIFNDSEPKYEVTPSASQRSPDMLARVKSKGSSDAGRMRSTFQAWKNSCAAVLAMRTLPSARAPDEEHTVLLRCSMPSPSAHGR